VTDTMQPFGENIWTVEGDRVRMFGVLPFTTRMTVVRLQSGGLWLHSPVKPTRQRRQVVDEVGEVRHLIAPNKIHSLGVEPWKALYPSADVWCSPEFTTRHPGISVDAVLADDADTPWQSEILHCAVGGHAVLDEVEFFHKPSRTLIVTDLIQKHDVSGETWLWRGVKHMAGILGEEGGVPIDVKLSVRDKDAMRKSIETILDWDFDNLIISHGHCVRGGAKEAVKRAFDWIVST